MLSNTIALLKCYILFRLLKSFFFYIFVVFLIYRNSQEMHLLPGWQRLRHEDG